MTGFPAATSGVSESEPKVELPTPLSRLNREKFAWFKMLYTSQRSCTFSLSLILVFLAKVMSH